MMNQGHSPRWWLLLARGVIYIGIGIILFVSANSYSEPLGHVISALVLVAGVSQLIFSFTNRSPESTNIWGILHGVADLVFGVVLYVYSKETVKGFVDMLGFWATMYAFLQAVQAMYAAIAARGASGVHLSTMIIHFANVLVAGGMAYTLLFTSDASNGSLGYAGLFPIVLGALVIALVQQMRVQSIHSHQEPRMG